MSEQGSELNDRQEAFVEFYARFPNATRAAQEAGYTGDARTLGVTGHDLLKLPKIRTEIDKRIRERIIGKEDLLSLVTATATADVTPYLQEDGTLDVQRMGKDGLGHLVIGYKPGRQGPEVTLANPQAARKLLARYHRILGADTQVDVNTTATIDPDTLASLAEQIAAANVAQHSTTEQSDTEQPE